MTKYEVCYYAYYYVEAENGDEALELGMEEHYDNPDGSWEVTEVD